MQYNIITDIAIASTEARPLFLFDSGLNCIFSGDAHLFALGDSLLTAMRRNEIVCFERTAEVLLYIDGRFYYAMVEPVHNEDGMLCYRCELTDSKRALKIVEMTDVGAGKLPIFNSMQYYLTDVWNCIETLRKNDTKGPDVFCNIEKDLYKLFAITKNEHEYLHSVYGVERRTLFDLGRMCCRLEKRCNHALAKCGRHFELVVSDEQFFVDLSSRRAVVALVNVIQNAMLYSPADTVPVMKVFGEGRYVVVSMTNESMMYSVVDFSSATSPEFNYQRIGSGLPMVRAFADSAGGRFVFEHKAGKVLLELRLPVVKCDPASECYFESECFAEYDTGVPDFVDITMREVVDFFGEKKNDN